MQYQPLEPSITTQLGLQGATFSTDQAVSFFSSASLIWSLGIMMCVGGAVYAAIKGGVFRLEASEAGIRKSNEEWKRGSLGLLGVMMLFLIIYTVNRGLLVGDVGLSYLSSVGGGSMAGGGTVVTPAPSGVVGAPSGSTAIASRIYDGAIKAKDNLVTRDAPGTNNGRLACAWAVNEVLKSVGIAPIGTISVVGMENALKSGRGSLINQSEAVPGDIVIEAGTSHVGICLNQGCTRVISNSSSRALFAWVSGPDFAPSYTNGIGRFYRVNS